MLSLQEFEAKWMFHHHPTMDLKTEIPFYYDTYQKIYAVVELRSQPTTHDDWYIIQMLMHVEDAAHLGLCLVYAKIYRIVEDMIGHWTGIMQLSDNHLNEIRKITDKAIQEAPESGMVRWIVESVSSNVQASIQRRARRIHQPFSSFGFGFQLGRQRKEYGATKIGRPVRREG